MAVQAYAGVVESKEQLRAIMGEPSERAVKKELRALDDHCRAIIASSPFLLMGTAGASGTCDVSPKGDAPGFVLVLDERTIAIPDRPGNRRTDSFKNILENPHIGLLFIVPGKEETLRVNGRATLVQDPELLARMAVEGKEPQLAVVVDVEEAYAHCPKSFKRAHLWDQAHWPDVSALPSMARLMIDHAKPTDCTLEQLEAINRENYKKLY